MNITVPLNAVAIRSRLMLQVASEIVGQNERGIRVAEVCLRELGDPDGLRFSSLSTMTSMLDVAEGKLDVAIANPSAALTLAYRGTGPFPDPLPLRTIAIIPSADQFVFAVSEATRLSRFEDIAVHKPGLRVLLRGVPDHFLHTMLDDIAAAAGFKTADLLAWGGALRKIGPHPMPGDAKFAAIENGEADAMFDEGAAGWVDAAARMGMTILSLSDQTLTKLEARGYRRAILYKKDHPHLPFDIQTVDFSGWPIFVRADLSDQRVTLICQALEQRKNDIAWQQPGPLPIHRMCTDTPEAPLGAPLHPAAERFWRRCGYLP